MNDTAPRNTPAQDNFSESLVQLLTELRELREYVAEASVRILRPFKPWYPDGRYTRTAFNLAQYLALRRRDLRPLQYRLARSGLSSLGRGEAHTMATLDRVIEIIARAVRVDGPATPNPHLDADFSEGDRLLNEATRTLLGPKPAGREVFIMVTLPTAAASDPALIEALLRNGMNCARINCAHDDARAWEAMIGHVRRAAAKLGLSCRVLMDLAGPKLRTGTLRSEAPVRHLQLTRDVYGHVVQAARVVLAREDEPKDIEVPARLTLLRIPVELHTQLAVRDRLAFRDTRGKRRHLDVVERLADGHWLAQCPRSAYLAADTLFDWQRPEPGDDYHSLAEYPVCPFEGQPVEIRLRRDDPLRLSAGNEPGAPPVYDTEGRLVAPAHIGCSIPSVVAQLQPGHAVWIDDGRLGAVVESVASDAALLRVTHAPPQGLRLRPDKGINLPDTHLPLPPLTAKDLADLDVICAHADMVGFSFVRTLEDMDELMGALAQRGAAGLPIIAKIETRDAVDNLPELLLGTVGRHRIGVMIARGDLAVELGSVRMAEIQEEILWLCEAAHVPVIWATQVLESIAKKGIRSRPEFTDAAMGVRADCVMLNKGPHILEALRALDHVLARMETHQHKKTSWLRALNW